MRAFAVVALMAAGLANSEPMFQPPTGIWHYQKRILIGGADVFTSLHGDGTCTQVMRGRAFGMTKWGAYACTWLMSDGQLKITFTEAPDQPEAVGQTVRFEVLEASAQRLLLEADGDAHEWLRVEHLPTAFAERLQASGEPTAAAADVDQD